MTILSSLDVKLACIKPAHEQLSIQCQCELLGLSRASYYYQPASERAENLLLMRQLDEIWTACPFYGSRRMVAELGRRRYTVNRKCILRLMQTMGLTALWQKPKTTRINPAHQTYPYLLRGILIEHCNQVWSTDITYIPMPKGFMYLSAVIDWYSRYALSWHLSNTLDTNFCLNTLDEALNQGKPDIFNTDQGLQFTSQVFTQRLLQADIRISMDVQGRAMDNIFVERLWRTVKYEEAYLKQYQNVTELEKSPGDYFRFYNHQRVHQSLDYRTPAEVYRQHTFNLSADISTGCLSVIRSSD